MAKLKSLTDLGDLYTSNVQGTTVSESKIREYNEILLTDATNYLPKGSAPKTGEGFGKTKEEVAKGTGPTAADNFEKVTDKQDPGSSKKAMKEVNEAEVEEKETEGEAEGADPKATEITPNKKKKNVYQAATARLTTPKEKLQERVENSSKNTKYNKPTFTMSKSKFDKLYEDAINNAPFDGGQDDTAPEAPMGDTGTDTDMGDETGGETSMGHQEIIDLLQKALDALKAHAGAEDAGTDDTLAGTEGEEETEISPDEEEDDAMGEAVDAEDLGHAGVGAGAKSEQRKDGHKIHKVGTLKPAGAASEQGGPKGGDGTVQKAKDFDKALQKTTGSREVGNLKVSKGTDNAFE